MTPILDSGNRTRLRRIGGSVLAGGLLAAGALGMLSVAEASGNSDDRRAAQQIVDRFSTATDAAPPRIEGAWLVKARNALAAATAARATGDEASAHLLDSLALEWAETARDLEAAIALEGDAAKLQKATADAVVRAERARTLLEEAIARNGRVHAELTRVSQARGGDPLGSSPTPMTPMTPMTRSGPEAGTKDATAHFDRAGDGGSR